MNRFWYKAKDMRGRIVTGIMRAEHEKQVYRSVREMGLFAVCLKELPDSSRKRPLSARVLADFSKQMEAMLKSGIPAVQAVHMLTRREKNGNLVQIYKDIYYLLLQGYAMSEALKLQNGIFPVMMVHMVHAGEHGGHMADTMRELSVYYEKNDRLGRKIGGALVYPVFLMVVVLAGMILLFTMVLPKFFALFDSLEQLPAATRVFMWISNQMVSHGFSMLIVLVFVAVVGVCLCQNKKVQNYIGVVLVHLPMLGPLMKTIYTARFSRAMSALYENGVPVVQAVNLTSQVMGNVYLETQLKKMLTELCEGVSLSGALMKVDGLAESLAPSVFIGEETGELQELLAQAASRFDMEAEEAAGRLTTLLEPLMIVVLGVGIGFLFLSVMMPLMQYYKSMG